MDNHKVKKRPARKLTKVRGYPGIFRIAVWNPEKRTYVDLSSMRGARGKAYRAVRRIRVKSELLQQARNFDTVEEARAWRMEVNPAPPEPSKDHDWYSMKDLLMEWRKWSKPPRFAESTWEIYGKDVRHYEPLFDVPVEHLTAEDIDEWLRQCVHPSNPKKNTRVSFRREVKTLITVLNWYREYKNSKFQSPMLKRHLRDCFFKEKPTKPDLSLSVADLERFLERLRARNRKVYYYLASCQALAGLRVGEACGLDWDAVDLEKASLRIDHVCWWNFKTKNPNRREGTKTGKARTVVMPPRLVQVLREWRETGADGPIVFHKDGQLLRYPAIQNAYKKAFRQLGLPVRSTHVMRHTFASIFAEQTEDIRGTQAALGHSDLRVTQHYAKVAEQTQRKAFAKFALGQVTEGPIEPGPPEAANVILLKQRRSMK